MEIRTGFILYPNRTDIFVEVLQYGIWERLTKKTSDEIFDIIIKELNDDI